MDVTLGRWITRGDDASGAPASVGRPTWGPPAFLRDLELRLGLPSVEAPVAEREIAMLAAARACPEAAPPAFHARSLAIDAAGTASVLLAMRDVLVEAGWRGDAVADAGPRIATLAALETAGALATGPADRLARVRSALAATVHRVVDRVGLLEGLAVWPGAWREVFELLRARGTRIDFVEPTLALGLAPARTDLGLAQIAISRGLSGGVAKVSGRTRRRVRGDGTLVAVRAATSWELGEATAALLRALLPPGQAGDALIVRAGDPAPLDAALVAQGLRSQGLTTSTSLRPAQQVLPLALALHFLPRDVHRALELLSLPLSPIPSRVRPALLGALAESAGVGSRAWTAELAAMPDEDRARVTQWIEPRGFSRAAGGGGGVPRETLLETLDRIRTWAAGRRAGLAAEAPSAERRARLEALDALLASVGSTRAALLADARPRLALHELEVLLAASAVPTTAEQTFEEPNRPDHFDVPDGILRSRGVVALWHAGADVAVLPPDPFRIAERRALAAAGVILPDPAQILSTKAKAWRRAVLAATDCLVVATPDAHLGQPQPVLPVWDEIVAGLGLEAEDIARITATAEALREGRAAWATQDAEVGSAIEPLALPAPGKRWKLDRAAAEIALGTTGRLSASGVETLLGCPLRFVLERAAALWPARVSTVSDGALLKGKLGHRLVEDLHRAGLLGQPERLREAAPAILDALIAKEAGPLDRRGRATHRAQIVAQLLRAVAKLGELLAESGLTVEGVEVDVEHASEDGTLHGRIDLVLRDREGRPFVLDLKLGRRSYSDRLRHGLAIQLAHYGEVVRRSRNLPVFPPTAYFSLGAGRAFALDGTPLARAGTDFLTGPSVADTSDRILRSTRATRALLARGVVVVTGVGDEPEALFTALGPDPEGRGEHLEMPAGMGCEYCDKGAICGRSWESLA